MYTYAPPLEKERYLLLMKSEAPQKGILKAKILTHHKRISSALRDNDYMSNNDETIPQIL